MAIDLITAAEMLVLNDTAVADLGVTDLLDQAPVLAAMQACTATHGINHQYLKETGAPVVGFRAANAGRDHDVSTDTLVTVTLVILDASFSVDKAVADTYTKGGADGWCARELGRHLKAAFFAAESQLLGGTVDGAAAGFAGLADNMDDSDDAMVVNAAGTTAATASSIYMIRSTGDELSGCFVLGQDGVVEVADKAVQMLDLANDGKLMPAYTTAVTGYTGLQFGSAYDAARICNITEDAGKGATDDLLSSGLQQFPANRPPTLIAMNRRSLGQLQRSRTATSPTGAPAPRPMDYEGIPIIITDAIGNTETLLTAA